MRLGRLSEDTATEEDVNLTPLIDIVFILLIFFVVTTTFAKDLGLDIERPSASTGTAQPTRIVRVAVNPRGELTVNARPTSAWRLEAEVRKQLKTHARKDVLLVSDTAVEAGKLVNLIDSCKRAGAEAVSVAVQGGKR